MQFKIPKVGKGIALFTYILNGFLATVLIAGTVVSSTYASVISVFFDQDTFKLVNPGKSYYESDYVSHTEYIKYEKRLAQQIVEEGLVLLKNDDVLPLAKESKLSLFGQNSVDFVYGGGGSGAVDTSKAATLKESLEDADFVVNETLWDFYKTGPGSSYRKKMPNTAGNGPFEVNEVPQSVYTQTVKNSYANYDDAAIISIGRAGGESKDIPLEDLPTGVNYLQVDPNEMAMIDHVVENFNTVILIVNANNVMELGFLEDAKYSNIKAVLSVGGVGQEGILAIGKILNGEVNPSGRLVDTYTYSNFSAPSIMNFGDYTMPNNPNEYRGSTRNFNKYLVYQEGIYVGYRYYETRYEDKVMNTAQVGDYDYETTVQFPFGYGLSYTQFSMTNYTLVENEQDFTITVDVKNDGDVAGKHVVQVYMQSPYTAYDIANGIEKPSVQLVGFAKTDKIAAAATEQVEITVSKEELKVYDAYGQKTYIVDAGDYYFAVANNAHDAMNHILSTKGFDLEDGMTALGDETLVEKFTVSTQDNLTFSTSQATEYPITNQFDDVDIKTWEATAQYVTRSNWAGSYPTMPFANGSWNAPQDFIDEQVVKHVTTGSETMPTYSSGGTAKVVDLIKENYNLDDDPNVTVDYDDPRWEQLLTQISQSRITQLVRLGGYSTITVDAIGLPGTKDKDGPAGISGTLVGGGSAMAWSVEVVMASTYNVELIEAMGRCMGEDSMKAGVAGWYAPGVNIHRSPFSGRNFEYFSEDGFLSGQISGHEVKGARSKGVITYMKHFALNDQETNRYGGVMFANEQSIREIYLRGFEYTVRIGKANAAMMAMNRIGPKWVGAHYGLATEVLRNEWGFQGVVITDQASSITMGYQDIVDGLAAGTDLWLNTDSSLLSLESYFSSATVMANVSRAAKNIVFAVANSNAMNNIGGATQVVSVIPPWQKTLIAVDIIYGVLAVVSIAFVFASRKWGAAKVVNK